MKSFAYSIIAALSFFTSASAQTPDAPAKETADESLPKGALMRLGTTRLRAGAGGPIAFSPDGAIIAAVTGAPDYAISFWDIARGVELRQIRVAGQTNQPKVLQFTPDGKKLISADFQGVQLIDADSGKVIRRFGQQGINSPITSVVLSRDRRMLWTAGNDKVIRQYLLTAGVELRQFAGHQTAVVEIALTPDGKQMVSVAQDGTVQIWDLGENKTTRSFRAGASILSEGSVALSPDARHLAFQSNLVSGASYNIQLFDVETGKMVRQMTNTTRASSLAFSPAGKVLAAVVGNTVIVFGVASGLELRRFEVASSAFGVGARNNLAFSPDGKYLVYSAANQAIHVWDLAEGVNLHSSVGHTAAVQSVLFLDKGKLILSSAADRSVRLWDADNGKELARLQIDLENPQHNLYPGPQDNQFFTIGINGAALCELTADRQVREVRRFDALRSSPAPVSVSADHQRFVINGANGLVHVYESATGKLLAKIGQQNAAMGFGVPRSNALALSPDGSMVALVNANREIQICKVGTGKVYRTLNPQGLVRVGGQPTSIYVNNLQFSPDGQTLATIEASGVRLWEVATGFERALFQFKSGGRFVDFSPDGRSIITSAGNGNLIFYDVFTGAEVGQLSGHRGDVRALAISPDGKTWASGAGDTTILLWPTSAIAVQPPTTQTSDITDEEWLLLWQILAEADAARAYQVSAALVSSGDRTVAFVEKRVQPGPALNPTLIGKWISDLDNERFDIRQKAAYELEKLGDQTEPQLVQALEKNSTLELQKRLGQLLDKLGSVPPEKLQTMRALEVLTHIGTPRARETLAALARGGENHWLTEAARKSLARIGAAAVPTP